MFAYQQQQQQPPLHTKAAATLKTHDEHVTYVKTASIDELRRRLPHELLNVSVNASGADAKKALRALSLSVHPDKNTHDAEATQRFALLSAAVDVLSDATARREMYAKVPHYSATASSRNLFSNVFAAMFSAPTASFGLNADYDRMFGSRQQPLKRQARVAPPRNVEYVVSVEELALGAQHKRLRFERTVSSAASVVQNETSEVLFDVPRGASDGHRIRLESQGDHYGGMKRGDLVIILKQRADGKFTRRADDIECAHTIKLADVVFGTCVQLRSIDGTLLERQLTAPVMPGERLVFDGHGAYKLDDAAGRRGNMVVVLRLEAPQREPDVTLVEAHEQVRVRALLDSMYT